MPRFRAGPLAPAAPLTPQAVVAIAGAMIRPANFFVAEDLHLSFSGPVREEVSWEIFRGRLLDPAHTRQQASFTSWNVFLQTEEGVSGEPLLSLKLDSNGGRLHVVRGVECYVWEGYDAGSNVYLSRERRKWVRELVGTVELGDCGDADELADELACRLFEAVVGLSRLPLTSVEAPLPAFSFGRLFYCYRPEDSEDSSLTLQAQTPSLTLQARISEIPGLNPRELAHLLHVFLLTVPAGQMAAAAEQWRLAWQARGGDDAGLMALLARLFQEVSLTPWTTLAEQTLVFLSHLHAQGSVSSAAVVDFLAGLLLQLCRHLTAYDLVTFHHRGANYPDALLLDLVLKDYLGWCRRCPELFAGDGDIRRRRALRQGWLLRRRYENHPVPDLPTSPGENARVLPPSHPRVPEEQIVQPAQRRRRLYADDPLPAHAGPEVVRCLRQSWLDLHRPAERRELGLALFLDRPFGAGKAPGEPDQTLLLASTAFSRSIATARLRALAQDVQPSPSADEVAQIAAVLGERGVPADQVGGGVRPGAVSLADTQRAAADFVFLRTTRSSLDALLAAFDFSPLAEWIDLDFLSQQRRALVASRPGPGLCIYDERGQPRIEIELLLQAGYVRRAGQEWPRAGLRAVRVCRGQPERIEEVRISVALAQRG